MDYKKDEALSEGDVFRRDLAIKAKEEAERKYIEKDFGAAKRSALRARALYPRLEGIAQMISTLHIHVCTLEKVNGETDFYAVLGVSPQADEDAIRKQYRKLALMLHPDKNKCIAAEGAFKLISEAWSLLSDKNRRAAYDAKRNAPVYRQKDKPFSGKFSRSSNANNGFYNFAKYSTSNANIHKSTSRTNDPLASGSTSKANCSTFWTVCYRCKMQYEYLRSFINHNLICPNCRKPFFAVERPPPVSSGSNSSKPLNAGQHSQKPRHETRTSVSHVDDNFQWIPFSGSAGASSVAQAASVVHEAYEKVKRVREEAQAAKKREKAMKRKNHFSENLVGCSFEKKRRVSDDVRFSNNQADAKASGFGNSEASMTYNARKINSTKELSHCELRNILMYKARTEIPKEMTRCKSSSVVANTAQKEKVDALQRSEDRLSQSAPVSIVDRFSIPVLDPDFHDFDKDRTEKAFGENQVWAVYDNSDGMPRYYAMIHRVISYEPFTVRISWLNSKSNEEYSPLTWVASGSPIACGDFRLGRHETYSVLNSFSHKVIWTEGPCGTIRVFPRKGDVWAIYRNWSPDWNEFTSGEVIFKYEMVEVVEDYDEWRGVIVIPLVKVAGFKAVFHRHLDLKQARRIPRKEISRFSYQVPSRLISGHEGLDAPKGCRELDPAALPPEFLKVIEDVKEKGTDEDQATQPQKNTDDTLT